MYGGGQLEGTGFRRRDHIVTPVHTKVMAAKMFSARLVLLVKAEVMHELSAIGTRMANSSRRFGVDHR